MRIAAAAFLLSLTLGSDARAAVLFFNGVPRGNAHLCHSSAPGCQGIGFNTYDDFAIEQSSLATGFSYNVYFEVSAASYVSTNWSIWSGDPELDFSEGPLASGTSIGEISSAVGGSTLIEVSGLDVALAPGTYWLGTQDNVSDGSITTIAYTFPGFGAPAQMSDNAGNFSDFGVPEIPFFIFGEVEVPEPAAHALVGPALSALGLLRRRARSPSAA